jgi:hypothetical protein
LILFFSAVALQSESLHEREKELSLLEADNLISIEGIAIDRQSYFDGSFRCPRILILSYLELRAQYANMSSGDIDEGNPSRQAITALI